VEAYNVLSDMKKRKIYDLSQRDVRFSDDAFESGQNFEFKTTKKAGDFYKNK